MRNMRNGAKPVFTTGEAARICMVSQQTIINCFDSGRLAGYRIPGSRFRKIPRQNLIEFMRRNNIPFNGPEFGKWRVLIVDDDPDIIEQLAGILEKGRFETRTASGSYEAGMMTERFRPDLILLEYMLPDVNCVAVCQAIKTRPEFTNTKIIIISGVRNEDGIERLLKAGAECFIRKPFTDCEIMDSIEAAMQRK